VGVGNFAGTLSRVRLPQLDWGSRMRRFFSLAFFMRKKVSKKLTPLINYQFSINLVVKLRKEKSREIITFSLDFSGAPFGHSFRCENLANFLNGG